MFQKAAILVVLTLAVAACGTSTRDRALTGGAAGAGAGALAGEIIADEALGGALIGGALGAGIGAITNCNQLGSCDSPLD